MNDSTPKSNQLRIQRERSRLTQQEVAKLLGIDYSTVSKHESGDRGLSALDIERYAKLYKVQTYELFFQASPTTAEIPIHTSSGESELDPE